MRNSRLKSSYVIELEIKDGNQIVLLDPLSFKLVDNAARPQYALEVLQALIVVHIAGFENWREPLRVDNKHVVQLLHGE